MPRRPYFMVSLLALALELDAPAVVAHPQDLTGEAYFEPRCSCQAALHQTWHGAIGAISALPFRWLRAKHFAACAPCQGLARVMPLQALSDWKKFQFGSSTVCVWRSCGMSLQRCAVFSAPLTRRTHVATAITFTYGQYA
eukprot:1156971-Amphidinium_carterae.1